MKADVVRHVREFISFRIFRVFSDIVLDVALVLDLEIPLF